jgi:glycosidase
MALAYLATTSRIPQIFYGSEILLTSPRERDDGKVRTDMPGGWPGDRVDAFSGAGLSAEQRAMQDWVRKLFTWRKTATVVHEGRLMQYAPLQGCYVFFRYTNGQRLMVVLNKSREATTLDTRRFPEMLQPGSRGRDVLGGQSFELGRSLTVPARSALIIELAP